MASSKSKSPLRMCNIIGDVVDDFDATHTMRVCYGRMQVTNGCTIKPSLALDPPTVTIDGLPNELYTLIMTDPDAPSPSDPSMREWVHWIVSNIPGGSNVGKGKEIVSYMAPCPLVGIHRYALILFKQDVDVEQEKPNIIIRSKFNTREFADYLLLGLPVAAVYFNARKEPMNQKKNV